MHRTQVASTASDAPASGNWYCGHNTQYILQSSTQHHHPTPAVFVYCSMLFWHARPQKLEAPKLCAPDIDRSSESLHSPKTAPQGAGAGQTTRLDPNLGSALRGDHCLGGRSCAVVHCGSQLCLTCTTNCGSFLGSFLFPRHDSRVLGHERRPQELIFYDEICDRLHHPGPEHCELSEAAARIKRTSREQG